MHNKWTYFALQNKTSPKAHATYSSKVKCKTHTTKIKLIKTTAV